MKNSPAWTSSVSSSIATTSPYVLRTSMSRTAAAPRDLGRRGCPLGASIVVPPPVAIRGESMPARDADNCPLWKCPLGLLRPAQGKGIARSTFGASLAAVDRGYLAA